ncbi:MAG: efflux RND transporter permease subunit, partial [Myxococcales bacterium]|nr:efflux RND transporter permease subunit [Myxococcales bacterium]
WTLRHPIVTMGLATVVFLASMSLMPLMGQEFAGRGDRGEFTLQVELPAGTSLARTQEVVGEVERVVATTPGHILTATTLGPSEEVNRATMRVKLVKPDQRARGIEDLMEELRGKLARIPGLEYTLRVAGLGDANLEEAPVTLRLQGPDYGELARISDEIMGVLRDTPGVRDAQSTYRSGAIENQLFVDRERAADLGVSFIAVAQSLRTALEGDVVAKLRAEDDDVDVRLRLAPGDRADLAGLRDLPVPSAKGLLVPVEQVTRVEEEHTPATIERFDGERQISITANVYVRSLGEVTKDLQGRLAKLDLPDGYFYSFAGEAERMNETFSNLGLALGLAVLFIYLVLASQFESLIHPLTIMLALPLAIIGAVVALFVSGQPMGLASMIGMILLMGLVTKNSILLVDYANHLRREQGKGIREALLEAGPTRLRPILMTSFAIILGMLPAALARGEGSEFQAPMAIAVIGGVITSTVLTLAVVPVAYVWLDRLTFKGFKEWRAERRAAKAAKSAATA